MRVSLRTALATIVALPLVVLTTAGLAGPATAEETMCEPSTSWLKVGISTKPWKLTHVDRYGVAPKTSISTTWTATHSQTITAGIEAWGEGSVSADGVLAKAEAKAGVSLAENEASTYTKTVSEQVSFGSAKKKRVYALFRAHRRWSGGFEKWVCNSRGTDKTRVKYGTWRSFGSKAQETTLCKRGTEWLGSTYPAGSLDRIACNAIK